MGLMRGEPPSWAGYKYGGIFWLSYARICDTGCGALSRCVFAVSSSRLFACLTAGSLARAPRAFGLWCCICWSSRALCRMRAGLMMVTLHQRHRFLHRRRRCLRVRCLLRLHGLWYLLVLRGRRSGTIRTSRMSSAFRAVPRPIANQVICHLLVTSARCHGDTSLVGCSSPLGGLVVSRVVLTWFTWPVVPARACSSSPMR